MAAYHGPQGGSKFGQKNKGVARAHREIKRTEAEDRNAQTSPERRRQYRLDPATRLLTNVFAKEAK